MSSDPSLPYELTGSSAVTVSNAGTTTTTTTTTWPLSGAPYIVNPMATTPQYYTSSSTPSGAPASLTVHTALGPITIHASGEVDYPGDLDEAAAALLDYVQTLLRKSLTEEAQRLAVQAVRDELPKLLQLSEYERVTVPLAVAAAIRVPV